ncbi:MAG TPA: RNA methyltransferase substrate-binding domain-containing protein, partial [Candidatus Limnocylindrales bacterium]|nr:RNA methyltransferase substrate-binding domain-containing protein [Candidatus Limnocylindrales bacterium]
MTSPVAAITSLTNPRIKAAGRLRDRRERDAMGLTLIDGARELRRALDAGVDVVEAFVCEDFVRSPDATDVVARLRSSAPFVADVSEAVLAKVAFGDRSDGIVAVVRMPATSLDDLALPTNALLVVVEAVEKPGNLGAILRT